MCQLRSGGKRQVSHCSLSEVNSNVQKNKILLQREKVAGALSFKENDTTTSDSLAMNYFI